MSSLSIRLMPEVVRSLAFGSISGTYMGIGAVFDNPIRILFVQNLTDEAIMISFDGIEDHFPLIQDGFLLLDVTSNKTVVQGFFIAEGQRLYAKSLSANPTEGSVYVSAFYGTE